MESELGLRFLERNGKEIFRKDRGDPVADRKSAFRRVEVKIYAAFIEGRKEGKANDVIPVSMTEEKVDFLDAFDGVAERTDARARIDDDQVLVIADFEAAGVAAKFDILRAADGA